MQLASYYFYLEIWKIELWLVVAMCLKRFVWLLELFITPVCTVTITLALADAIVVKLFCCLIEACIIGFDPPSQF